MCFWSPEPGENGPSRNNKHAIPPNFRLHALPERQNNSSLRRQHAAQCRLTSRHAMRRPGNNEKNRWEIPPS
ncbi:hypothetical protein SI91_08595 [Akkermansia muciniphila]|nr:hypothetical protein [Akkermansia muciniphila]MCO6194021.1 hypothetical protein [Akkermansia muciniphila]MCO6195968.1 hypothetical protein [Akkermansia muciniphila]MCO6197907.1 hypothetical protein [Akkermansia muciniphila]